MLSLKSLALAAALAAVATPTLAGGFAPAVVEPDPVVVVEPAATRSTFGILLPLLLLGALVVIATQDGDEEGNGDGGGGGTPTDPCELNPELPECGPI